MKKMFIFLIVLTILFFVGCVQESKYPLFEQYGKYFDANASSFEKINLSSFHEAIKSLDKDSNIELIELNQEYVDLQKDKNFIRGMAYCGNREISFGSYALRVTNKEKNFVDLNSISEIKQYFPINDSKKAATFVLLELDNVDYNSIYVLKVSEDYLVKLIITPSACDCGEVQDTELWLIVRQNGIVELAKTRVVSKKYQSYCIS